MKKLIASVILVLASGVALNIGIAGAITYFQDSPAKDAAVSLTEAQIQDFWNEGSTTSVGRQQVAHRVSKGWIGADRNCCKSSSAEGREGSLSVVPRWRQA